MGIIDRLFANTALYHWVNHRNLYLLGLSTIIAGLSWSNALMSIGQFILLGNFLLELNFKQKFSHLFKNPYSWILLSIYILHIVGLLWTSDFDYAIKDLRIKLPLLLLPIIVGSSPSLKKSEWKLLLQIYLLSLLLLSLISFSKLLDFQNQVFYDKRGLSIRISHIRYGLNLAFAAAILLINQPLFKHKLSQYALSLYFIICLLSFELYSGLLCFVIFLFVWLIKKGLNPKLLTIQKLIIFIFIALVAGFGSLYIYSIYQDYARVEKTSYDQTKLQYTTANNNYYWSDTSDYRTINGVRIIRNISIKELRSEWPKRSEMDLTGKDKKGQKLEITLIHYLTSKGYNKDSIGLHSLTDRDIVAIENGVANYRYLDFNPIEKRFHTTFYEIDIYRKTGYVEGLSLALRLHYWKTGWDIIQKSPWYGIGTGDVNTAFQQAYEEAEKPIAEQYRRRTHNQYLTFSVAFGIVGFCLWIFYLLASLLKKKGDFKEMYIAFWIISVFSFFTEDTLETQAGVTFFALFNILFVLGINKNQDQSSR